MVEGGSLKIYASMMKSMDAGIGRVLQALAPREARAQHAGDLHERQRRRAILVQLAVLVSEVLPVGRRHSRAGDRALARRDPAGRVTDQAAMTMDWTATILAATGTTPDPAYPLDGEDLMPVCTGARAPSTARCSGERTSGRPRGWATGSTSRTATRSICSISRSIPAKRTTCDRSVGTTSSSSGGPTWPGRADAAAFNERRTAWEQQNSLKETQRHRVSQEPAHREDSKMRFAGVALRRRPNEAAGQNEFHLHRWELIFPAASLSQSQPSIGITSKADSSEPTLCDSVTLWPVRDLEAGDPWFE